MIHIAWFLLGAVFGIVFVIIVSCCAVASECDRKEERWYEDYERKYWEDSEDDSDDNAETR